MPEIDTSAVSGVTARGYRRGATDWDQFVVPVRDRIVTFTGRATTFITPGRAAVGQKILALHNATSSAVIVNVNRIRVDVLLAPAAGVAPTVVPPLVRIHRFTAVPTNGTVLAKTGLDTAASTNASVTAWGDASADGTSSGTTLTVTAGAALSQAWSPRIIVIGTSASSFYEPQDPVEFFTGEPDVTLRALEGLVVFLDQATVTTGNPTTSRWVATVDWDEYTRP